MMNITLALFLVGLIAQSPYCMHQAGCFRYNCGDFTYESVILLRYYNFTAYPMCNIWHYWVGLDYNYTFNGTVGTLHYDIEPQTGQLFLPLIDPLRNPPRRCIVRGLI